MQDNTKVLSVLGAAMLLLVAMGVASWIFLTKEDSTAQRPEPVEVSHAEVTENQINVAQRAVSINGIYDPAIQRFRLRMGRYPASVLELTETPDDPEAAEHWDGPYVNNPELLTDPWGNHYHIRSPGFHNESSYDLWSLGPDKIDGTVDDIGNW